MSVEVRSEAKRFAEVWKNRGYEKGETQSFWLSLLRDVFRVEHPDEFIKFEEQVKLDHTSFMDGHIEATHVLIEQKSLDKDLNKPIKQSDGSLLTPFQQAKRYAAELPYSMRPRWIVLSNFKSFLVYDMEQPNGEPEEILLENLEKEYYRLQFLVDAGTRNLKKEQEVSVKAGELVGKLYDALLKEYKDADESSYHSLNVLCVRLVFCFYAEDAGLFGRRNMFHDYMKQFDVKHWRKALIELFEILDTPEEERDKYIEDDLGAFPYVNGGLFADRNIEVPNFTDEIINIILEQSSEAFDWSVISPSVVGACMESTMNPETRREAGAHFTSLENLHRVLNPLFLDSLSEELDEILQIKVEKKRNDKLKAFQNKLASIHVLDTAAGSCNFLTESYICLRRLENRVLEALYNGQMVMGAMGGESPIKVGIHQLHGIEYIDFSVVVGKTSLWIAESQMMKETEDIIHMSLDFLPLKSSAHIEQGDALKIDWKEFVGYTPGMTLYLASNPPYRGYSLQTPEQKEGILSVYVDENGKPYKTAGKIDYVAGWFFKAAEMMQETNIRAAFVSTNSITQGEQVASVWKPLYERFGIHIDFAYRTFRWNSEAASVAAVHCVIIGFSSSYNLEPKRIYSGERVNVVKDINPYLIDGPTVFIESRRTPICDAPAVITGNRPADGGNLIIEEKDYEDFIKSQPEALKYIKKLVGAEEFIKNKNRYCLWLLDAPPQDLKKMPKVMRRIEKTKEFRLKSTKEATRKSAEYPALFQEIHQPSDNYLIIPVVSSENRRYVPMGYMSSDVICTDRIKFMPNATLYRFGVLESNVNMAWLRAVCGRLKSDYNYSINIVYNNFPWPKPTDAQKEKIEATAQAILDARANYPDSSLADLYDEVLMPPELRKAHQENDKAVMQAYGFDWRNMTESECVAELMKIYLQLSQGL